ncbi:MAG: hypothetical protein JWP97_6871, partial [Labilithrix sp.]|nr:hypothetical protein [Labilithrix sp.]
MLADCLGLERLGGLSTFSGCFFPLLPCTDDRVVTVTGETEPTGLGPTLSCLGDVFLPVLRLGGRPGDPEEVAARPRFKLALGLCPAVLLSFLSKEWRGPRPLV